MKSHPHLSVVATALCGRLSHRYADIYMKIAVLRYRRTGVRRTTGYLARHDRSQNPAWSRGGHRENGTVLQITWIDKKVWKKTVYKRSCGIVKHATDSELNQWIVFTRRITMSMVFVCVGWAGTLFAAASPSPGRGDSLADNPLLPPAIVVSDLWPDLTLNQSVPSIAPGHFSPLYSARDWRRYEKKFAPQILNAIWHREMDKIALATNLLDQAKKMRHHGLARLLDIKAFALTFQSRAGSPVAQRALVQYMTLVSPHNVVELAPIWTMSQLLAYLAATPPQDREHYAALAERADVQLTMTLLHYGQVAAAARTVRLLVIEETLPVRQNPVLLGQIENTRALTNQSVIMMDYLDKQYHQLLHGNVAAATPIYLYALVIQNEPLVRRQIARRWPNSVPAQIQKLLLSAPVNSHADYDVAKLLHQAGTALPWGILHDRTLFASLQHYRIFLNNPKTKWDRISRTLAKIAVEHLIGQGARPQWHIAPLTPFLGAAATTPAS